MNIFREPEIIARYRRLRAASRGLYPKVQAATRSLDFDMIKAARKMTLPVKGRTLIFNGETESNALMDFYFHEFQKGGRRVLECCDPATMGLSTDERDLLEAHRTAWTSLFEIVALDSRIARVQLSDILSPGQPDVMLSDISMSQSESKTSEVLVFLRVVACQGIQMTSGCFFGFSRFHRQRLLDGNARRMETVPPGEQAQRRFIFFFQRHREFGEEQAFATPG